MKKDLTISTLNGKIAARWIPDELGEVPTDPKEGRGTADPAPATVGCDSDSDKEDIIKILEDAIANSPNPARREDLETDSGTENHGIESVEPSGSEQEEVTVDPNIVEESKEELPETNTENDVPEETDKTVTENNNNDKEKDMGIANQPAANVQTRPAINTE